MNSSNTEYAHPEYLVSTEWVADNLDTPNVRLVEVNDDPELYTAGHIPGAVEVNWYTELNHPLRRDVLDREGFQALMRRLGADENTTIVFYGHLHNWMACSAFWMFTLYGHKHIRIMNGGRLKWSQEQRPLVDHVPDVMPSEFVAPERDEAGKRFGVVQVLRHWKHGGTILDVRGTEEYRGERLHMHGFPNDGALRTGRIPNAIDAPWTNAVRLEDSTFKSRAELEDIYCNQLGLKHEDEIVIYCRVGKRSSHSWFVLTKLLGFEKVRNYDGSWLEWGNMIGTPIERGA